MPSLRVMTFNVENMLTRFNFRQFEQERLATLLDSDNELDRANLIRTHWNAINDENRVFTALTVHHPRGQDPAPEVVCLQEVENMHALRAFHDRYLRRLTAEEYTHKVLVEANDPRGIDVAVMSRFKIDSFVTRQELTPADIGIPDLTNVSGTPRQKVFSRDCLEVHVKKHNKILPIFICHLKSMSGGRAETRKIRHAEATAVRQIVTERFGNPDQHPWLVVGDLNDFTETDGVADNEHGLGPLLDGGFSVDLVKRINDPLDRWTHFFPSEDSFHQLDYILASPALANNNPNVVPTIVRNGQPHRAHRHEGERWPRVGYDRPKASDHCPVVVDLEF